MKDWSKWLPPQRRLLPSHLSSWLTDTGSLTQRLKAHNVNGFNVALLGQHWMKPLPEECVSLQLPVKQMALQREVKLLDGKVANVYARTVIPLDTYHVMKQRFNTLGNKPLGELLFTDPSVERGAIEVACLHAGEWLYELALLGDEQRPEELWARRSRFSIGGKNLLVNEIFLPTLRDK